MHKNQFKQLSFPILSETQLIETFNSLSIDASAALRSPNTANTRDLYQKIILKLLDCTLDELLNENPGYEPIFSYPELHEQSTTFCAFLMILFF